MAPYYGDAAALAAACAYMDAKLATLGAGARFVDAEVPAGLINSLNLVFMLAQIPNPAASLMLFKNGMKLSAGSDFTLSGQTITYVAQQVPRVLDAHEASYRY